MRLPYKLLMMLFALGTILWSCNSFIYDDMKDCPQGVYVKFYTMTPCESDSIFIGSVPSLTVFAFDKKGTLVTFVTQKEVTLSREYEILMPVSNGSYSFVAWAGVNDAFTTTSFTKGVTTKKDLMLTLKLAEGLAPNLSATRVWQGESETVFLPNPDEQGSFYEHTAINLKEITNRLTVSVEIDSSVKDITPRDLTISVSSANGNINIDGTMPITNPLLTYPTIQSALTDNSVTWNFALMDLKTGYQNRLKIDYPAKEQTLFDGDLIGSILLNTIDSNINLECENDFVVKFVLKDYCETCGTHFSCEIYVNNWRVHSYETELGI